MVTLYPSIFFSILLGRADRIPIMIHNETFELSPGGSLFPWKFVFELTGQLVYVRCFAKRLNFLLGRVDVYAHVFAKLLQHLKDCCQFLFRKHANLKIQMRAPFGLAGHSTLTDEHEGSQKDAFQRNHQGQDAERKWIKYFEARDHVEICQAPAADENEMSH